MKEYKVKPGYGWHAWFWVDKEEFEGEWKIGRLRYRVEKAVGRADDGKLFLMVWTNLDQHDSDKFSQAFMRSTRASTPSFSTARSNRAN